MKASPLRTSWTTKDPGNVSCIYKFWFGKKYYIGKSQKLHGTVDWVAAEVDRRLRLGVMPDHLLYNIVNHVRRTRVISFSIEILFQCDNPEELLKEEFTILRKEKDCPECLNATFVPYIPKWISESAVVNYEKWKKSYKAAASKSATKNAKAISARGSRKGERSIPDRAGRSAGVQRKKENAGAIKKESKRTIQRPKR